MTALEEGAQEGADKAVGQRTGEEKERGRQGSVALKENATIPTPDAGRTTALRSDSGCPDQRWKKGEVAESPPVLIFHSCENVCVFSTRFLKGFAFFCAIFGIFTHCCKILNIFLPIFCVLIVQAQSFESAIL